MTKLKIFLKDCYGINKLEHTFDFSPLEDGNGNITKQIKSIAIYAPNGSMKSSLAKTFADYKAGTTPSSVLFDSTVSPSVSIKDNDDNDVDREEIFIIKSTPENTEFTNVSDLLVDEALNKRYTKLMLNIQEKEKKLVKKLEDLSKIKNRDNDKDINKKYALQLRVVRDLRGTENLDIFLDVLEEKDKQVARYKEEQLGDIDYQVLFSPKTENLYNDKEFIENIKEYTDTFQNLMNSSSFFSKGAFTHINADKVLKELGDNNYFEANHKLVINNRKEPITSKVELEEVIKKEKEVILKTPELLEKFNRISKQLDTNADTRALRDYLYKRQELIQHLSDIPTFKSNIWVSYFHKVKEEYTDCITEYTNSHSEIEKIENKAKEQQPLWDKSLAIFKERFQVPFEIEIENKISVAYKGKNITPKLTFYYKDKYTGRQIKQESNALFSRLSTGEQRAYYLLSMVFEIERRKLINGKTFYILDDIADSFDYHNKYAIIQYLYDIQSCPNTYMIILTHNYDFFRTICSRLHIGRAQALFPQISSTEIKFAEMKYLGNPFAYLKNNMHNNSACLIASIPFMRNLEEYRNGNLTSYYKTLTSLLHIKVDSANAELKNLMDIAGEIFPNKKNVVLNISGVQDSAKALSFIFHTADGLKNITDDRTSLIENKIVLAIAIRLKAEQFLIEKIKQKEQYNEPVKDQTHYLIERYKELYSNDDKLAHNSAILANVQIMTPENIHINSFMFEPILDMGYHQLADLFDKVSAELK